VGGGWRCARARRGRIMAGLPEDRA
jgi:hypothetical protein